MFNSFSSFTVDNLLVTNSLIENPVNRHNPITTNATETIFIPNIENNFENSNANIPPINPLLLL